MKLLLLLVFSGAVFGQPESTGSYRSDSYLCRTWNCINSKLGFPESSLPPRQQTEETLRWLLPDDSWQNVVDKILDKCYGDRPRIYTSTCTGQALLHCVVDQMIENCPEGSWRKDDACSPVSSFADQTLFTQRRYENLEKILPRDLRPSWYLKDTFDSKCCDLPTMFNKTVLEECGISSFINYKIFGSENTDVKTFGFKDYPNVPITTPYNSDTLTKVDLSQMASDDDTVDPLDCCDTTKFIQPSWRSECDFHLSWGGTERLVISNRSHVTTEAPISTTEKTNQVKDLMLVPHSCEKETCVFRKLGIIDENGVLDIDAYLNMLQNFISKYPVWTKATARVVTNCLVKSVERTYEAECLINKLLGCTLDVLTESCPYNSRDSDNCKFEAEYEFACQISSSKYRPKNRREKCRLPKLIPREHLTECGLEELYRAEYIPVVLKPRKHGWYSSKLMCTDSGASTTCIINKMGVLNKYDFMDNFMMKDKIRQFTIDHAERAAFLDVYTSAFLNTPMYAEYCGSEKKLLNVFDAMVMTCPISMRRNTVQCKKIFEEMIKKPEDRGKENVGAFMKYYHHSLMPPQPLISRLHTIFPSP